MIFQRLLCAFILPLLFAAGDALGQDRPVTGKVTDTSGAPIANASVSMPGSRVGTQTTADGSFTLRVPSAIKTLIISSVGFNDETVSVEAGAVEVVLQPSSRSLNEVVVVGYGTARKKDLTGSVTSVTSKDFQQGNITTPDQLIAGKVAGVSITSNGGAPGAGSAIRIRGGASLSASNDPLIVVDGVPLDPATIPGSPNPLSLINPNDIESFNILKDASAAAIYGSRASNGVIIITTKRGKRGKPVFSFSTQLAASTITKKLDIFSPDEFRDYVKAKGTPAQVALLGTASTNWQDQVFHTAISNDNNFAVSGAINKMPYRLSVGWLDQNGILRTGNLQRTSASLNVSPLLFADHLKIDINLKGSLSKSRFANVDAIGAAINYDPTRPIYSGNNRFGGYFEVLDPSSATGLKSLAPRNPLGLLNQKDDRSDVQRSIGNVQFDYKFHFLPELHANLNLGYDISQGKGTTYWGNSAASNYQRYKDAAGVFHGGVNNNYLQKTQNTLGEFYLNYVKDLKSINSRIDAVAGYSYQNFLTTTNNYPDYTADKTVVTSPLYPFDKPQHTLISYYGRLNYNFAGRYLLTATIRTDGSSRFSKENRWGTFPSAAFAWRIKDENFLKSSSLFSELKLRLGYGKTGQQEGIGLFDYISYYNLSTQTAQYQLGDNFYNLYRPGGYYYNRKWEETETYNAGLDFGFLNNRISGTLDFYYKKTGDLLNEINQSAGTNFSNKIVANVGNMQNKGVELSLNTNPVHTDHFNWDVNVNFTYNQNKITKLTISADSTYPGNRIGTISGGTGNLVQINSVNYARSSFYVYQQVYDAAGKPIEGVFVDRNGDGLINENDLYRYKTPDPKFFIGFSTNASWNKWTAGLVLRANIGNYVYNNVNSNSGINRNIFNPLGYLNNGSKDIVNSGFYGVDQDFNSDYYVQNASFLRMDNVNIGYSPGNIWGARVRISANVQNVFTITKYTGLDPEMGNGIDNNFYPRPRTFVLGLNLDF